MINQKSDGEFISWTNGTGSDVVSGQLVAIASGYVGVATGDIAASATGTLSLEGVFNVPKDTVVATIGTQPSYLASSSTSLTTATTATVTLFNVRVHATANSAATTVDVRLF